MLMLGFGEKGDLDAITKAKKLADESNCLLLPRDFVPAIVSLAKHGHSQQIPQALNLITNHIGYNRDMMAAILQLCSLNKFQDGIDLFWTLRRPNPVASSETSVNEVNAAPMLFGRFLVRSLLKHNAPVELVVETMGKMRKNNINSDTTLDATRIAAELGNQNLFRQWMGQLHKEQVVDGGLRQHMFWPLFRMLGSSKETTATDVVKSVEEMKAFGVDLEQNSFVTLAEFLMPAFSQTLGGDEKLIGSVGKADPGILAQFELLGYEPGQISFAWLVFLLKRGFVNEAKAHLSKKPKLLLSPGYLSDYLSELMRNSESNLNSVTKILQLLEKNSNMQNPDAVEQVVGRTLVESIFARKSTEWPAQVIEAFSKAGLKPGQNSIRVARGELERRNTSQELLKRLDNIATRSAVGGNNGTRKRNEQTSGDYMDVAEFEAMRKMSTEQLETMLEKAKSSEKALRVEKYLLMRYCQFGDIEKAEKLKAKVFVYFIYYDFVVPILLDFSSMLQNSSILLQWLEPF